MVGGHVGGVELADRVVDLAVVAVQDAGDAEVARIRGGAVTADGEQSVRGTAEVGDAGDHGKRGRVALGRVVEVDVVVVLVNELAQWVPGVLGGVDVFGQGSDPDGAVGKADIEIATRILGRVLPLDVRACR